MHHQEMTHDNNFILNLFLLFTMNVLTGVLSCISAILLILFNFKNIRRQIIEEGGFVNWIKNFINFKKTK